MFRSHVVVVGAFISSCVPAGCNEQSGHATDDAYDSRTEAQSEVTTDAQFEVESEASDVLSDTVSQTDSVPGSDIEVRIVDNCEVIDGDHCEEDCMPLYSTNRAQTYCAVAGVFFGCVPGLYSGFWPTGDVTETGEYARCDYLKDDPKQHLYCFEETFGLYWFYNHMDLFCEGTCIASPDAAPCPE